MAWNQDRALRKKSLIHYFGCKVVLQPVLSDPCHLENEGRNLYFSFEWIQVKARAWSDCPLRRDGISHNSRNLNLYILIPSKWQTIKSPVIERAKSALKWLYPSLNQKFSIFS